MTATERTEYYLEKLFWPTLGAAVLVCASYYNIYQLYIITGVYLFLAYVIAQLTINLKEHWNVGAVVGLLAGALIGIIQSLFVLIIYFSVPNIFAALPRTLITAVSIGITTGLLIELYYFALRMWTKQKTKPSKNIAHTNDHTDKKKKSS